MKRKMLCVILCAVVLTILCSCSSSSGIGEKGISLEEFNKLWTGMEVDSVEDIVGGSGTIVSESEKDTEKYIEHTRVYKFEGEKSGYAELEFVLKSYKGLEVLTKGVGNYELTSKTQHDLK